MDAIEPKTRVFRLNTAVASTLSLDAQIVAGCDKQLLEGFSLRSSMVVGDDLILVFQNVDKFDPPKPPTA